MKLNVTTESAMAVSREKWLIILPKGLELKKSIGERATFLSMELWRELLRWTNIPPIKILANPDNTIIMSDRTVKICLLPYYFCSRKGREVQEAIYNRRYPIKRKGMIAKRRTDVLNKRPGD